MFDDIFKDTDFGNIKGKGEKEDDQSMDEIVENATKNDVWHTGQAPDIWAVEKELWDTNDDCDGDCGDRPEPSQDTPTPQSGIFDDIF